MGFSVDFFRLQVRFAQKLVDRFGLPLETALYSFTPFALHVDRLAFGDSGMENRNIADWAFGWYESHRDTEPEANTSFGENRLFGRFYYVLRDGHIIRPHIAPIQQYPPLLSSSNRPQIQADLRRMFQHIREYCPEADTLAGNSWLYNLPAYRALFPPKFTQEMPVSSEGEFHYLALWGQFYNRHWRVREHAAQELLKRTENLGAIEDLLGCFPLQILMPRCGIEVVYDFYEAEGSDT